LLMYGGGTLWNDDLTPNFDSLTGIQACSYLTELFKERLTPYSDEHSLQGSLMENGLAAMDFGSTQAIIIMDNVFPGTLGFALPPGGKTTTGADWLSVSSKTSYKQECVDLVKFFYSPKGQMQIFSQRGRVPTRLSLKKEFTQLREGYDIVFKAMENAWGYGVMNKHFFEVRTMLANSLEEAYYGKKTPEQAMKDAGSEYRALLK
jgi:ABC-type glycerol-3-phosphate transport system substrate-binding protein